MNLNINLNIRDVTGTVSDSVPEESTVTAQTVCRALADLINEGRKTLEDFIENL